MMLNTQQPLYYEGFGILILNLQTFSSVSKCFKSSLHRDLMRIFYLFQLTRAVMILWKSFWNQVSSSKIFKIAIFFFFIPPFSPIFRCIIIIWCSRPQQSKRKTRWCDLKCFWWGGFYHTKNEMLCIICMYTVQYTHSYYTKISWNKENAMSSCIILRLLFG